MVSNQPRTDLRGRRLENDASPGLATVTAFHHDKHDAEKRHVKPCFDMIASSGEGRSYIIQKFGGTSLGKFSLNIVENIIRSARTTLLGPLPT